MVTGSRRAAFVAGLLATTALALWIAWPAFSPGRIVNLDAPRHLLRTVVMATQFLPSGHVDGWSPYWYLGAQLFLFQSYGYFFLMGASAQLLSPWVSLEAVFKAWYVLPVVALPLVTAAMARGLGVAPRGAVAAALASLAFSSPQGFGTQGTFGIGLLLQGAGILGFALAWPEVLAVLLERGRAPWKAVLLLGATLVVHFITGAYALAASGLVAAGLAWRDRDPRVVLRYALVAGLVLLLAAHALFPSLEHHELSGASVGWGADRDRWVRVLAGTLFGARPLAIAGILAAAWALRFAPRPLAVTAAVFFGTVVLAGSNEQGWEPDVVSRLVGTLLRPRALPYAALFQAVFAGLAVDLAMTAASRLPRRALASAVSLVVAAAFVVVAVPEAARQRRFVRTESMLAPEDREVYLRLVDWLRENARPPAIVGMPRTLLPQSATGARSTISLLNLDTGLFTLGGDQAELQKTARHGGRVDFDNLEGEPGRNAERLRQTGVSWVIVSDPAQRKRLAAHRDYDLVFEYRQPDAPAAAGRRRGGKPREAVGVAVFRLEGGGSWLVGQGVEAGAMTWSPERLAWDVTVRPGPGPREVTAAVNWHPSWKARVDGREVETRRTESRRVSFRVPARARRVELEFVRGFREKAWNALSAVTLAAVLAAWLRARKKRLEAAGEETP